MSSQSMTVKPYGAYEMKATYQRNLLLGMLGVMVTIGLVFGVVTLASALIPEAPVTPIPVDTTLINIHFMPPQQPISDPGSLPKKPTPPAAPRGAIPVAVPVNEANDSSTIPTRQDWSTAIGTDTSGGTHVDNSAVTGVVDQLPSDTEFVPVEKMAEAVFMPEPNYPNGCKRLGFEGVVVVKALVDKDGSVRDVKVARSSGFDELDRAAIEAAFKGRWSPAIQNGQPRAVWVSYRVKFKLN